MNARPYFRVRRAGFVAVLLCALAFVPNSLRAGETPDGKATEEPPPDLKNWIEIGIGGVITDGDRAQFEQEHHRPGDEVFGGIRDLHYEQTIGKDVQLVLDGHAIFDTNDYGIVLELSKPKLGYVRFGYDEYRTWYDGNAGYFRPNGQFFPPPFPEMHIDRGEAWVELGLRVPDWPEITLRYSHEFRDGQKDSTMWGDTNLTGIPGATRKIAPAFRDINETRDIFSLEATKTFGNTDVLLGMRYEHTDNDDTLNLIRGAGQLPPAVRPPGAQRVTVQRQQDDVDLFSGHAITETRITDSLWFTTGYSYTTMTNDLTGSRIFGTQFDSAFGAPVPTLGQRDHAFIDLSGTAQVDEHVFNANLFWMPLPHLTALTGFRYTHENRDSEGTFLALEPERNMPPFTPTNPENGFHYGDGEPASGMRSADYDRFAERMEFRYDGIANWLFYAQGEWEEEWGQVKESHTNEEVPLNKDTDYIGQKYTIGANWYPLMRLSLSGQYYHKIASYGDDIRTASFPRLIDQDWNTDDVNFRMTFRPKIPDSLGTLTLISRYDFIRTAIDGQWEIFSPGELLDEQQTGVITKHVITESINWSPLARLYFQADISYILDQTETPANNINLTPNTSPSVVNFRNDYYTLTAAGGYALDDKTELRADYTFYRANDYFNNSGVAVPYGMGASEHTASVSMSRDLTKSVRLLLKYTYYNYTDATIGGHNNYQAHSIFSSLLFRF